MIAKTSAVDTRFLDVGFRIRENYTGHTVKKDATSGCWNINESCLPRPDSWMSFLSLLNAGRDSGNVFHNEMLLHGFPRHKMICKRFLQRFLSWTLSCLNDGNIRKISFKHIQYYTSKSSKGKRKNTSSPLENLWISELETRFQEVSQDFPDFEM